MHINNIVLVTHIWIYKSGVRVEDDPISRRRDVVSGMKLDVSWSMSCFKEVNIGFVCVCVCIRVY